MRRYIACFILLMLFWVAVSWSLALDYLVVGALASLVVTFLIGGKAPRREWLLNPVRLFWLFAYLPYFAYQVVKANLEVAYRVLHPDVPIRPGIVKVRTTLTSNIAKTFLAASITLTPGTLAVDIIGQDLYIHWIYVHSDDPQEQTRQIVKPFEGFLKRIFE